MTRLFVAIDPPDAIRKDLVSLCGGIQEARWVPAPQLHVTLRFLGEVGPEASARCATALEAVREPAFSIAFSGVGRFPPNRPPRVLWTGIEPAQSIGEVHASVESSLRSAGIAPDEKRFSPHLTLARLRENASRAEVCRWLERWESFRSAPVRVSRFFLYSSVLGPDGARHQKERSYDLTEGAA